jgi:hypothetical protein
VPCAWRWRKWPSRERCEKGVGLTDPPLKEHKRRPRRIKRAPSLGRALKQVRAAGEKARTARVYSDHVEIDLGEPEGAAGNDLDTWMARRDKDARQA